MNLSVCRSYRPSPYKVYSPITISLSKQLYRWTASACDRPLNWITFRTLGVFLKVFGLDCSLVCKHNHRPAIHGLVFVNTACHYLLDSACTDKLETYCYTQKINKIEVWRIASLITLIRHRKHEETPNNICNAHVHIFRKLSLYQVRTQTAVGSIFDADCSKLLEDRWN